MDILAYFSLMIFIQLGLYLIMEKFKIGRWKPVILILIILLSFYIYPRQLMRTPSENGINCGNSTFAVILGIWFLAITLFPLVHFSYLSIRNIVDRNNKNNPRKTNN